VNGADDPHRFLEAPPRPVAQDGTAESFARREAEACDVGACRVDIAAAARLEDKGRRGEARSVSHMQKFSAGL
jgi:hypothetical protein